MTTKSSITMNLIAPCGANCATCTTYQKKENSCPGCRIDSENKPRVCKLCVIKNCENLEQTKSKYCSTKCIKFPCTRLKKLDKRYRTGTKCKFSMIENLENIEKLGIRKFLQNEKIRWTCSECGGIKPLR